MAPSGLRRRHSRHRAPHRQDRSRAPHPGRRAIEDPIRRGDILCHLHRQRGRLVDGCRPGNLALRGAHTHRVLTVVSRGSRQISGERRILTVTGISTRTSYGGKDLHHSVVVLWSRIQPGDTLELSLSVASGDKAGTQLEIDSFQAGYRALGPGAQDHPYYRKIQQRTAADVNSSCVQNYMCSVPAATTPAGQATVEVCHR